MKYAVLLLGLAIVVIAIAAGSVRTSYPLSPIGADPDRARNRSAEAQPHESDWQTFEGSWSALGTRRTLPTEGGREAAVVELSGAVTLTRGAELSRGFHGGAIGFDDGGQLIAGRAVWSDGRGDRIFIVLKGEPLQTGRRIEGTIAGGTGRYGSLIGDFELTWQYVVAGEGDAVQGRTVDLKGRFRYGLEGGSGFPR